MSWNGLNCFWCSIWMHWNLSVESHYTGSSKYSIVNSNGILNMTLQLLNCFPKWSNKVPKQELEVKALFSCLEKTITMLERHRHLGHYYPSEWNFWYISSQLHASSYWIIPPSFIIVLFLAIYIAPIRSWTYNHILHPSVWEEEVQFESKFIDSSTILYFILFYFIFW